MATANTPDDEANHWEYFVVAFCFSIQKTHQPKKLKENGGERHDGNKI